MQGLWCVCVYIYICNTVSLLAAHFTIYGTLMANNEIKNIINTTLPHNMSHDASTGSTLHTLACRCTYLGNKTIIIAADSSWERSFVPI